MTLKYVGEESYIDTRFIAEKDDLVEFEIEEAKKILEDKPHLFRVLEEVKTDGTSRKSRSSI